MNLLQVVPREETIGLDALLERLQQSQHIQLEPFSNEVLSFCERFSRALFRDTDARRYPELQSLAFWMRPSELLRLKEGFFKETPESTVLVPRGLVLHVPPSNVDTIFIYSWILSVLAGNRNVIRISERAAEQSQIICRLFNQTLADSGPALAENTVVLRYGHDREITAALSKECDVRVLWGGDVSVSSIRTIPLPPHAQELTFPDRYSLAVAHAPSYYRLEEAAQRDLAKKFYNDTFWFNQMACSSPRLLLWCGGDGEMVSAVSARFFGLLREEMERAHYSPEPSPQINKFTFACRAIIDAPIERYVEYGACSVLELDEIAAIRRDHCGGGLLFQGHLQQLHDLVPLISRKDQSLVHFGFSREELTSLVRCLKGRGIDRIIPFGQALEFHRHWDGYDLLREFTRVVVIKS